MKHYAPTLVAGILLLAGCIKHPQEPPGPPRPQWLINKVIMVTESYGTNPLPGDPPLSASKQLWEIEYNEHYKPVIRRIYSAGPDTVNLVLQSMDTLFYDAQYRVTEMRTVSGGSISGKSFSYHGNDTLPFQIQSLTGGWTVGYAYRGDTVAVISADLKGDPDTSLFIYPGGNLSHYLLGGKDQINLFESYDNGRSIESCMNLSMGEVFTLPFYYLTTPRLSRNNWTYSSTENMSRNTLYNEQGLPVSSSSRRVVPSVRRYRYRYEYFETRP
jgi:hypothetical protein